VKPDVQLMLAASPASCKSKVQPLSDVFFESLCSLPHPSLRSNARFDSNVSPVGLVLCRPLAVALQQFSDDNIDACILVHSLLFVRCILSSGVNQQLHVAKISSKNNSSIEVTIISSLWVFVRYGSFIV
jgi:hypothetical protein